MALTPGSRLGAYEVTAQIGEGGMGQVYRARDTRLNRDVALKVLPHLFANDVDRLARLTREAQTLASLNHPNIAHIHGLEESNGVRALVMELVEGEDLSQWIARGAIPIDEALPIAKQIAEALEAAQEQGIIHRDLKPANIKVREDGTVKVLDFGLAKALEPAVGWSPSVSMSPTITTPAMTQEGVILGTAAYMSPEQARGKTVDKRSDIWAFGCVFYEMLTRRRAFQGEGVSDTLANILTQEPDWNALPANTPTPIRTLLRRCLEKDRKRRLDSATAARLEIDDVLAAPPAETPARAAGPTSLARAGLARAIPWTIAAVLAVVLGLWIQFRMLAPQGPAQPVAQLEMSLPAGVEVYQGASQVVAFSPAGTHVAFVGSLNGVKQVFVRDLSRLDAVAVPGSTNALSCFFSPAGDAVGFITDLGVYKVSLRDLLVTPLAPYALNRSGGTWGSDGRVTFSRDDAVTVELIGEARAASFSTDSGWRRPYCLRARRRDTPCGSSRRSR